MVENAEKQFGVAFDCPVVSIPDLYGGKIVAALDRQHPRDIFDIKLLMENEGLSSDIITGFLIYLSSHNRPFHEVLSPTKKNMQKTFNDEFIGMTNIDFSYEEFEKVREKLSSDILKILSIDQRNFLLSLQIGTPNWTLLNIQGVEQLPAVKWKLENIQKMSPERRAQDFKSLQQILNY